MLLLATDTPSAKPGDGDQIILTIPNGDTTIQVALTIHQAVAAGEKLRLTVREWLNRPQVAPKSAKLVKFPSHKTRRA